MRYFAAVLVLAAACSVCGGSSPAFAQSDDPADETDSMPRAMHVDHEPETEPESFASWVIMNLGLFGLLSLLSAGIVFVGALIVVALARRPAVIAAYLVFLLLPLWLGVIAGLKGAVSVYSIVAVSGVHMKDSHGWGALGEILVAPLTALLATFPSYLVIAFGLFVRALLAGKTPTSEGPRK